MKTATMKMMTVEDALEELGVGCFTVQLIVVCGLGWLVDTAWITAVISATVPVQYEFPGLWELGSISINPADYLLPLLFACQGVGGVIFGPVADSSGRRFAFMLTLLVSGSGGVIGACAPSMLILVLGIAVAGLGVGGNMPVDGALAVELCPRSARGRLMTLLTIFWSIGGVVMYLIAWAAIPNNTCDPPDQSPPLVEFCDPADNRGWRYCLGAISLICLASVGLRVGWPESPAWLMAQGRTEDVIAVLEQIGKMNGTSLPPDFILVGSTAALEPSNSPTPVSPPTPVSKRATRVGPTASGWDYDGDVDAAAPPADRWAFLQLPWMRTTAVLLAFLWFLSNFGYGIFNSMNLELVAAKLGGVPTSDNTYLQAIYMSAAAPVGALVGAFIVDSPLGRKWTLVVGILTMATSMIGFLRTSTENGVVMTGALTQATSQIMYAALYLYTPEVFPTAVRGTCVSMLSLLSRVAGIIAPIVGHTLFDKGVSANGVVFVGLSCIGTMALFGALLPLETRNRDIA